MPFAARLTTLLDQGHGLIDRFLVTFPKCLRPTPQETNQAVEALKEPALSNCEDIFSSKLPDCILCAQPTLGPGR